MYSYWSFSFAKLMQSCSKLFSTNTSNPKMSKISIDALLGVDTAAMAGGVVDGDVEDIGIEGRRACAWEGGAIDSLRRRTRN